MKIHSQLLLFLSVVLMSCQEYNGEYVCKPCDLPCDTLTFAKPGTCPHCGMMLIKRSELIDESEFVVNEINIDDGSGVFIIEGGEGKKQKNIKIYYHKPENFTPESKILIVIPGAGRNGDSYRDAWIEESERHGVLVLSPMYDEEEYPFEAYHLCGLVSESNLRESVEYIDNSNVVVLDEENFTCKPEPTSRHWIFQDFDRLFDLVKEEISSTRTDYDLFGHSAGGQILHRLAIFHPDSKANRIIAANSGFYTLPDIELRLPFGIKDLPLENKDLANSFNKNLILLIGENDNADETGGTLLRSPTADKQGKHRLSRGHYFYEQSKKIASELGTNYNWQIETVPNVGHNHDEIGNAAALLLYHSTDLKE